MQTPISTGQIKELLDQEYRGRINGTMMQRFLERPEAVLERTSRFGRSWHVTVSYDLPWERVREQLDQGARNMLPKTIELPRRGQHDLTLELYEFDEYVTGHDAIDRIEADGYQNEDILALCTFCLRNPIEQVRRPIIALGTQYTDNGLLMVPSFGMGHGELLKRRFTPAERFLVSQKE